MELKGTFRKMWPSQGNMSKEYREGGSIEYRNNKCNPKKEYLIIE